MNKITVQDFTTKNPIQMIGLEAGVCWGADTTNTEKNYKRGLDCLKANHGRTLEFPQVYVTIDGYSARVIRELYCHIAGMPSRLQSSTRYIDYKDFDYVIPPSIRNNSAALQIYMNRMKDIANGLIELETLGIPKEDIANLLPLGMETKIVLRTNARNLIDMSHQRMCSRAYHEYRELFNNLGKALSDYSDEWKFIVDNYFMPKCELYGYCTENKSCGRKPKKED